MSDHKVEIFRTEYLLITRWAVHIDWPYGPIALTQTRWGAYRKARRMLREMDEPREIYFVPRNEEHS